MSAGAPGIYNFGCSNKYTCATDCHPYMTRNPTLAQNLPLAVVSEQRVANEFPWWGLWRTRESPPLPTLLYPMPQLPRGVVEVNETFGKPPLETHLTPNWALTR